MRPGATREPAAPFVETGGWIEEEELAPILDRVRGLTMVPHESLLELARQTHAVLRYEIQGDLVECGVWRGGASFLMADLLRRAGADDRKVWLLDSFEGLPPPEDVDGATALDWAADPDGLPALDNLRASVADVQRTAAALGLEAHTELVKGLFEETLASTRERIGAIALLRIDCDWYSGVKACLDALYDQVSEGGFVVLDDYYALDGCALALHEFLGARGLAHRIETVEAVFEERHRFHGAAVLRKGEPIWSELRIEMRWQRLAVEDLLATVPAGERFVLLDDDAWGVGEALSGRPPVRFLERDGDSWGPPADDDEAIEEVERLAADGTRFMAVAWPAFWWLDHYRGLAEHLRSRAGLVVENERLVVFDLRG